MEEVLSKEAVAGGWPWKIFVFMLLVLSTTVLAYGGLILGYQPVLKSRIEAAQSQIDNLANAVSLQDQKKFLQFYSQILNLRGLLSSHVAVDRFFDFLEKDINKKVAYEVVAFNALKSELTLEGVAENYDRLSEQLAVIAEAAEVKSYTLNQSQFNDGRIRFRMFIILKPEVFKAT